jgi:hypothetical protein
MNNIKNSIAICFTIALLTSCSSVDFYQVNESGDQEEVGFLYYPPKPFLLIETKDNNISTSIISLPDLSRPHRVKQSKGWGTAELGFVIENGMIKSFNSKIDSKGPETIASIASLGTAQAAIDAAEAAIITAELAAGDTIKMTKAGGALTDFPLNYKVKVFVGSSKSLEEMVLPILETKSTKFSYEIKSIKQVISVLKANEKIDYAPFDPDKLLTDVEKRRKIAKQQADILKNITTTLSVYSNNGAEEPSLILLAKNANAQLKPVMKSLLGFSLRSSSVNGLYEIGYTNGRINLKKVIIE